MEQRPISRSHHFCCYLSSLSSVCKALLRVAYTWSNSISLELMFREGKIAQTLLQTAKRTTRTSQPEYASHRTRAWPVASEAGMQGRECTSLHMQMWSQALQTTAPINTQTAQTSVVIKNNFITPLRLKGCPLGASHLSVGGGSDISLVLQKINFSLLTSLGGFLLFMLTTTLCPKLAAAGVQTRMTLSLYTTASDLTPHYHVHHGSKPSHPCCSQKKTTLPPPLEICLISLGMPKLTLIQNGFFPDIIGFITILVLTYSFPPSQDPADTSSA
jgi:hypothetical protein